jgi:glycosyltransferase involved in cell wall biosynthesis
MPKILYVINEDWAFASHFLPMARAARNSGFDVVIATRIREHGGVLERLGCRLVSLESERRSLGPFELLRTIYRIAAIIRAQRPDIVHCIALRMVVLGGLAARLAGARAVLLAPTGLGHLWIANGSLERIARPVVRWLIGCFLHSKKTHYLFENADDPVELGLDPKAGNITLVGGAGVNPGAFRVVPEPVAPPVKIAVIARMLHPKGIAEAVAAVRQARLLDASIELHLFGAPDVSNRLSFSESELRAWSNEPGIYWHGATGNPARIWQDHHIAMLLSYREGLPKSLVEAAASGRPIIATDVVGCREVVRDGIEGRLVALGDIASTTRAITELTQSSDLRAEMGRAAYARFQERFTEQIVLRCMEKLYSSILKIH